MDVIKSHLKAASALNEIKKEVIGLLGNKSITEKKVLKFILRGYKKKGLKTEGKPAVIISFGKNTSSIHHFPKNIKLKNGPVMLDLWAKEKNGCFADFTFMLYKGKPDKEFMKYFAILVKARDKSLKFIKSCLSGKYLPTYFEIDSIARAHLAENRMGYAFQHRIGHSLGKKVHAGGKKEYYERLKLNVPYTLEPGIYFKGKYGIRIENDFWIDSKFRLHLENVQSKLIII